MRRRVLTARNSNEQVTPRHSYNLRSATTQGRFGTKSTARISFTIKKKSNVGTPQITSFFDIRKRRNSEQQQAASFNKKVKPHDVSDRFSTSNQLSSECSTSDKENDSLWFEEDVQVVPEVVLDTPLGIFGVLPRELLYELFDRTPVPQLAHISLLSNTLNTEVRCCLLLGDARRRFAAGAARYIPGSGNAQDPFRAWGLLLRASTITMSMRKRLAFLMTFFSKNRGVTKWHAWGRCFLAFCEKWSYYQRELLMRTVMQHSGLNGFLRHVMQGAAGKYPQLEIEIRDRFRGFFLSDDEGGDEDRAFWHSVVLRTQKTTIRQAKLFMIIFGPSKTDENNRESVDWELLCDTSIESRNLCERIIGPMSSSLCLLIRSGNLKQFVWKYGWEDHQIFDLIEDISTSPNHWTLDNFAALLALRPQLIDIALHARITHGHHEEAAHVFHAVQMVLHQWGIFASVAINHVMLRLFRGLPDIYRRRFLSSFLTTETQLLCEVLLNVPFNRGQFYMEAAVCRAVSPLRNLLAENV